MIAPALALLLMCFAEGVVLEVEEEAAWLAVTGGRIDEGDSDSDGAGGSNLKPNRKKYGYGVTEYSRVGQ